MPHPDLLTSEDLATRHGPKKLYTNKYLCVANTGVECAACHKQSNFGEIIFSCCPPSFDSMEAAIDHARATMDKNYKIWNEDIIDYLGTFEL